MTSIFVAVALILLPYKLWAAKTCSEEARYMVSRAAECLDRQDVGCAKLKLDPILVKEPNCADALFVRGWILENYDQNMEKGQAMQDKAVAMDPTLSDFWEQRGHSIEAELTSQQFSHFDLQFYGAEDRGKAWDAVKYLNEMYDHLGSVFGTFPAKHIPVIVFTTGEFMDAWRAPFIGGFFDKRDGKVRIRVDEMPGGDAEFRHRARHEFTHAFIRQVYPQDLPSWVSEGVAEFYARHNPSAGYWKEDRLEQIRRSLKGEEWLTLDQIQDAIAKKRASPATIQSAYLESEALVLFVAKERGDSWIPNVIHYLRDHDGTFDAAFQAVIGRSPAAAMEQLHHSWE